jgi:hypothetical protein
MKRQEIICSADANRVVIARRARRPECGVMVCEKGVCRVGTCPSICTGRAEKGDCTMSEDLRAIIRQVNEAVWYEGLVDLVDEYYAQDFIAPSSLPGR